VNILQLRGPLFEAFLYRFLSRRDLTKSLLTLHILAIWMLIRNTLSNTRTG